MGAGRESEDHPSNEKKLEQTVATEPADQGPPERNEDEFSEPLPERFAAVRWLAPKGNGGQKVCGGGAHVP
jgi:hypothetical protein